jgi:hypothetical protein
MRQTISFTQPENIFLLTCFSMLTFNDYHQAEKC